MISLTMLFDAGIAFNIFTCQYQL